LAWGNDENFLCNLLVLLYTRHTVVIWGDGIFPALIVS